MTTPKFSASYNTSRDTINVFHKGKMYQVPKEDARYEKLKEHLHSNDHCEDQLDSLLDVRKDVVKITAGAVELSDMGVTYNGKEIHGAIVDKLFELKASGAHVNRWVKFLDNLMKNPSYHSRDQLYTFLEKFNTPITQDGKFLAFKAVGIDYLDLHTRTFDNFIGQTVSMPRRDVDDNPSNTCSAGLHVAASSYLDKMYMSAANKRIVVVEVDPADVVSVPNDYDFSKMRVCKYKVIDEIAEPTMSKMDNYVKDYYG